VFLGVGDYVHNDLRSKSLELGRGILESVSVAKDYANALRQICEIQISPKDRYVMASNEQCTRDVNPDEAGSAKNEYTHENIIAPAY
jgi:hypothetical protein